MNPSPSAQLPPPGTSAFAAGLPSSTIERTALIVLHLPEELAEVRPEIYRALAAAALVQGRVVPFPAAIAGNISTLAGLVVGFDRAGETQDLQDRIMRALRVEFGETILFESWWNHLAGNLATLRRTADEGTLDARGQLDRFFTQIGVQNTASTRMAARRGIIAITVDPLYAGPVPEMSSPEGLPAFVRGLPIPTAHVLVRLDAAAANRDPHEVPTNPEALWTSEVWLTSDDGAVAIVGGLFEEIVTAMRVPAGCDRKFIDDIVGNCRADSA